MTSLHAVEKAVWLCHGAAFVALMAILAAGSAYSQDDFKDGVISVTVQNEDGSPAAGLEVQCAYWGNQIPRNAPLDASERATTDTGGRCTFSGLPRYHYMLHAATANAGAWKRATLFSNQTAIDVTLTLKSLPAWTGTVCDDQGNPLPGVMVCVDRVLPAAVTGEDGKWRIDNVSDVGEVSFMKEGYGCAFAGGLQMMNPVQIFMRKGVVLDCRLEYPDGSPAPGIEVDCHDMKAWTDENGRFRTIPFPPDEKIHLQAWRGNEVKGFHLDSTVIAKQGPVQEVTLQFEPYAKSRVAAALRHPIQSVRELFGSTSTPTTQEEVLPPAKQSPGVIKGTLVDTSGKPVEGVPLMLMSAHELLLARTNPEGKFAATEVKKPGEYRFRAEKHIPVGPNGDVLYTVQRYRFVEGESVTVKEGESIDVRVVVDPIPAFAVAGKVIDETGAAVVRPQIQPLVPVSGWFAHSDDAGWFVCQQGVEIPFFIEFVKRGYQAVVLECGKQLKIGDLNSKVVMKKGPFADGESVFAAVTGFEDKPESWTIAGVNLKEREDRYRSLAQEEEPQRSQRPASSASKSVEPNTYAVRVMDAKGNPVTRIFVQRAESYTWTRPTGPDLICPDGAKQVMDSPDGLFNVTSLGGIVPNAVFVSADGTGAVLVRFDKSQEEGKPVEVVLHPAAKVVIHVTDYDGQPVSGVSVGPPGHEMDFHANAGRLPLTDATGAVTFDLLPPGGYSYRVYVPRADSNAGFESVSLNVEPGQTAEGTLHFGELTGATPEAEVDRWCKAFSSRDAEKPPVPDQEMTARMAEVISQRLNGLPGKDSWELRQAAWLAEVSKELGLKSVAPALVQAYSRLAAISTPSVRPAGPLAEAIGALGGDEAVDALSQVAATPGISTETSADALIALCALRSEKAIKKWVELRDAAFQKHGAPKRKESYTHAEKIMEAIQMTFHVIPLPDRPGNQEWIPGNLRIWVAEDYKSAKAWFSLDDKGYNVLLERFGPEWMVVGIDHIVMS